ncbi:hypothetical protein, partial [Acidovorax sp.]|uniref:hypothetical protein n=1 Tax=Acidovorax sp. TaxID=1872122 RepID=UPI00391F9287
MGLLDKIVGAVTGRSGNDGNGLSTAQNNLLRQAMEPLDKAAQGLADKALAFVTDGTHEAVLLELQAPHAIEPGQLLGAPGRLRWG